jgi:hypothetical protein
VGGIESLFFDAYFEFAEQLVGDTVEDLLAEVFVVLQDFEVPFDGSLRDFESRLQVQSELDVGAKQSRFVGLRNGPSLELPDHQQTHD